MQLSTVEIIYLVFTIIFVLLIGYCVYNGQIVIASLMFIIIAIATSIITGFILPHLFYYKKRVNELCEKITRETDKDADATWVTNANILDTTIELIELMQDIKQRAPRGKIQSIYEDQQDMREYIMFIHQYRDLIKKYKNGSYIDEYKKNIANVIAIDIDTECESNDIINNFYNLGEENTSMHRAIKKELSHRNSKYKSVMEKIGRCRAPTPPSI